MPNEKRMTPIRVPDMQWMEKDIQTKFCNHRHGLEAERDMVINNKLDTLIPKYIKAIGIDKMTEKFKKAHDKRKDFELNMHTKLSILEAHEMEISK